MNRWLTIYYIEIQFPLLNDNWTRKGKGKNFLTCIKQSQCSLNFDIVNCCCNSNWKEITFFLNLIESKKRKTRQTFVLFFHSQEQFLFSALGFTNEKWKPFVNWNCTRALQYTSHGRTHSSIVVLQDEEKGVKIFIYTILDLESKSSSRRISYGFRGDGTRMSNYRDRRRPRTGGWKKPRTAPIVGNDHDERGCRPG